MWSQFMGNTADLPWPMYMFWLQSLVIWINVTAKRIKGNLNLKRPKTIKIKHKNISMKQTAKYLNKCNCQYSMTILSSLDLVFLGFGGLLLSFNICIEV